MTVNELNAWIHEEAGSENPRVILRTDEGDIEIESVYLGGTKGVVVLVIEGERHDES